MSEIIDLTLTQALSIPKEDLNRRTDDLIAIRVDESWTIRTFGKRTNGMYWIVEWTSKDKSIGCSVRDFDGLPTRNSNWAKKYFCFEDAYKDLARYKISDTYNDVQKVIEALNVEDEEITESYE